MLTTETRKKVKKLIEFALKHAAHLSHDCRIHLKSSHIQEYNRLLSIEIPNISLSSLTEENAAKEFLSRFNQAKPFILEDINHLDEIQTAVAGREATQKILVSLNFFLNISLILEEIEILDTPEIDDLVYPVFISGLSTLDLEKHPTEHGELDVIRSWNDGLFVFLNKPDACEDQQESTRINKNQQKM